MKEKTLRKMTLRPDFDLVLIAVAAVCLAISPAARAQAQLEYTPVPVVIANVYNDDFVDTETQPHILVAINTDATDNSGGGIQPVPPTFQPPMFLSHTVVFPSGDSVQVDRGNVVQIAVTATSELMLQPAPADVGIIFPPPNP